MIDILDEIHEKELRAWRKYVTYFLDEDDLKSSKVLDLGCGSGWISRIADSLGVESYVGIDKDLSHVPENSKSMYIKKDVIPIPFEDNYFNIVFAFEILEHLGKRSEERFFEEISRVLKPGGYLYLSTPNNNLVAKLSDPAWWVNGHRHYESSSLLNIGESFGFKLIKRSVVGRIWYILWLYNLYISRLLKLKKPIKYNFFINKIEIELFSGKGFYNLFFKWQKN